LFVWFAKFEHQAVINSALQFLATAVIQNTESTNLGYLSANNKISNTTPYPADDIPSIASMISIGSGFF